MNFTKSIMNDLKYSTQALWIRTIKPIEFMYKIEMKMGQNLIFAFIKAEQGWMDGQVWIAQAALGGNLHLQTLRKRQDSFCRHKFYV